MQRAYTIGCPGVAWWEYGLMLLGFIALIFLLTLAYQLAFERVEFARKTRRRRLAEEAEGAA